MSILILRCNGCRQPAIEMLVDGKCEACVAASKAGSFAMTAPGYRAACAEAAKPVIMSLGSNERVAIEGYANSEFWAGWNAAIAHAAHIARNRYNCWHETAMGAPDCDASACEDIAKAIDYEMHRGKAPVSRPLTTPTGAPK